MCDYMSTLNEMISQIRLNFYTWLKKHNITQEEAAKMLGVSRSHLNKVLNGSANPSINLINKMSKCMEE